MNLAIANPGTEEIMSDFSCKYWQPYQLCLVQRRIHERAALLHITYRWYHLLFWYGE